jgi:hypothetical protein
MSYLAKLNLKTVHRNVQKDPVVARRDKLLAAIEEQYKVLAAAQAGEVFTVTSRHTTKNEAGERVQTERQKRVRPWFFEQDGGCYVHCRYGSRILNINGKSNAVFVDKLADVASVLDAFKAAAASGELDKAIALATKARSS